MNVVATAPMPGRRIPSLPCAGLTSTPFLSAITSLRELPNATGEPATCPNGPAGASAYTVPGPDGSSSPLSEFRQRMQLRSLIWLDLLSLDPPVDACLEHIERQRARAQHLVVEGADVELRAERV